MIGKIKEFNFKSLLILNTFTLIVTSFFFNNPIYVGVYILFFFISLSVYDVVEFLTTLNLACNA